MTESGRLVLRVVAGVLFAIAVLVTFVPQYSGGFSLWTYSESIFVKTDDPLPNYCFEAGPSDPSIPWGACLSGYYEHAWAPFSGGAIESNIAIVILSLTSMVLAVAALVLASKLRPRPQGHGG